MTESETTGFEAIPLRVAALLAQVHASPSLTAAARRLVEAARFAGIQAGLGFATRQNPGGAWGWHTAGNIDDCGPALREALGPETPGREAASRLEKYAPCTFAVSVEGLPPNFDAVAFGSVASGGAGHPVLELLVSHAAVAAQHIIRSRRSTSEVRAYQALSDIQREARETQDPVTFLAKAVPILMRRAPPSVSGCVVDLAALDAFDYPPQRFILRRDDLALQRSEFPTTSREVEGEEAREDDGAPTSAGLPPTPAQPGEGRDVPHDGADALQSQERLVVAMASPGQRHGTVTFTVAPDRGDLEELTHFARAVANALGSALARMRAEAVGARGVSAVRELLDILPDPALVHRDGKIIFANERLTEFLGYERAELLGAPVLTVIAPQDRELAEARMRAQQLTGAPVPPAIEHIQRKDGSIALAEIAARPALFEGAMASIAVARDVTEREELARRAAEADRLATVGVLAAGIGHEINNPLTYIKGNLQYLRYRLGDALDEELQAALRDAETGARRIESITKQIRLLGTKGRTERTTVRLAEAVRSAYQLVSPRLDPVAEVTLDIPPDLLVHASEEGLSQLLTKLLFNAAEALDRQTTRRGRLKIRARRVAGRVEVSLEDNGPGVPDHLKERIFLPFVTTKEVGDGSGLGLALARQVVTDHGGELTVEDTPGGGATFRFSLPGLPTAEEAMPASAAVGGTAARRKLRVLLVDDEPLITDVLQRLLSRSLDVVLAHSAAEALARIQEYGPVFDAIVVDVAMPTMNGIELADEVAARWPELQPRILLMTGAAMSRELAEKLRACPYPSHIKPIGRQRIIQFANQAARFSEAVAARDAARRSSDGPERPGDPARNAEDAARAGDDDGATTDGAGADGRPVDEPT